MPKFHSLVFTLALASVSALPASADTPSFNCAKETYPDERTTCSSADSITTPPPVENISVPNTQSSQAGFASQPSEGAQDAPATDCDTYAASPLDPERKADGVPVEKLNPIIAIPACENAVRQYPNSRRLIYQLGRAYAQNNDFSSALFQYRKAAEEGYASAENNLGVMYANGQGVPQDFAEATKWYRLAADQGNAVAQANLGVMYANGQGVPQDFAEALKWYRIAAAQGDAKSQTNLGVMYANSQGVPQDFAEALKRYRLAADQGNAKAQSNLGIMYTALARVYRRTL